MPDHTINNNDIKHDRKERQFCDSIHSAKKNINNRLGKTKAVCSIS